MSAVQIERGPNGYAVTRYFRNLPAACKAVEALLTVSEAAFEPVAPLTTLAAVATPLLAVLVAIETTDIMFALDSIPAVFAVTTDPFIVFSSNLFAILGLRALFFVLAGALDRFHYLKPAVAMILVFVGAKMVAAAWIHVPTLASLAVIVSILLGGVGLSILRPRQA